ncbi:uncharacterized protein LOC106640637 [Copidosoma floridanum]|uniref:uncharacterized protein LOC106640637 n=1 Tax=Copidosoma floridanum TaxID=29053 RepID=UPI0006C96F26|nr:uncharacterized protein LOC106640637 [Copidosoma floridanum]
MSSSNGANYGLGVGLAGGASTAVAHQGQGVAALLVMIAVLCFMFAYCCWGAPFCRSLCRRHNCCYGCCCCWCCCRADELAESESSGGFGSAVANEHSMITTPTIILLPHGRTFVVHGRIFTQFQADDTGLDLVELGESVMRAQRGNTGAGGSTRHLHHHHHHHRQHHHQRQVQLQDSQGSIIEMDADTPSKGSIGSLGCFPPPTYESIYGKEEEERGELPPSYSDILLHRFPNLPFELDVRHQRDDSKEELRGPRIIDNPIAGTFGHHQYPRQAYSSQSLPRRNPSLISNPLDGYYVDNELASLHCRGAISQRRRSAAADVTRTTAAVALADDGNDEAHDSRTNSDDLAVAGDTLDNRLTRNCRRQESRSQNDLMNSRNMARTEGGELLRVAGSSEIYARRCSEESIVVVDVDGIGGVHRLEIEPGRSSDAEDDDCRLDEDEVRNFQALADIRESRV